MREALRLLETGGLTVSTPHHGTYIAEIDAADRIIDLDIEFHRLLCTAPSNRRLLETWTGVMDQVRTLLLTRYRLYDGSQDIAYCHQVLLDAVRAADPALAARLVEAHIRETAERVLRKLAVEASALKVEE